MEGVSGRGSKRLMPKIACFEQLSLAIAKQILMLPPSVRVCMCVRTDAHLRTLAIVFVFAGKIDAVEALQHLGYALGRMRQHRLQRCAGHHFAFVQQLVDTVLQQYGDNAIVIGALAVQKKRNDNRNGMN